MNHVQIELTNKCNFQCEFCEIKNHRVKDELPIEQVYRILDEIKDAELPGGKVFMVSFNGVGEPLLYPQITEAVKYAKERFPFVGFITNGYGLTEKVADEMLALDIDYITVSINAVDAQVYSKFQGYGFQNPEKVMNHVLHNMNYFLEQRKLLNKHTEFRIPYLLTEDSKEHFPVFLEYWKKSGYEVLIQTTRLMTFKKLDNVRYTRCERLTEDFMIFSNGDITICACDQTRGCVLGNIYKNSIAEVINGPRFAKIVKANEEIDLDNSPKMCLNCEKRINEGFLKNYSIGYKIYYTNNVRKNIKWKIYSVGIQCFSELKKYKYTYPFFRRFKNYMFRREYNS